MKDKHIEILVRNANAGDTQSLEQLILHVKDDIYNLSLKMLLFPEDAKDATQDILIKVITHLSTFTYKSKFSTWVYRIATNYLLTQKGKRSEAFARSFSDYETLIDTGQSNNISHASNEGELKLLEEEVKVSCTQGLLLCLKPLDRLVYIMAEILEFNSNEGAQMLDIKPENFRKKLSRSRTKIRSFLSNKCGLVNSNNPCRCTKKIDFLVDSAIINSKQLRFAGLNERSLDLMHKISHAEKSVAIYRSVPRSKVPGNIFENLKLILSDEKK